MWDQVGTKCEQFCRKITGNLCSAHLRRGIAHISPGEGLTPPSSAPSPWSRRRRRRAANQWRGLGRPPACRCHDPPLPALLWLRLGQTDHLLDGHPHSDSDRGDGAEDSHIEKRYQGQYFWTSPVETHSAWDHPLVSCKGKKEEVDTAGCTTHLHSKWRMVRNPARSTYPQSDPLKKVVDGKCKDDKKSSSCSLDAFFHGDRNIVAVAVSPRVTRYMSSPAGYLWILCSSIVQNRPKFLPATNLTKAQWPNSSTT